MINFRLKEVLALKGITAYRIASMANLSVPTAYRLARASTLRRLDMGTLERLCDALDVEPGELLQRVPKKSSKK